ncbi:MAG: biopolymer transporter ExbD [Rickettsiales bacterium]|jgi:biopolymer transport protein TolR|nr:biopolymer transporter ExbD [Rickettsiales bacterium]
MPRKRKSVDSNSLIVMTPMIDVMTVLLAVFVVTAPMLTSGVDLDLPTAGHSVMAGDDHAIQIGVDSAGRYFIGREQRTRDEIVARLVASREENPKLAIMINGDRGTSYGAVMQMMGALKDAGFQKVGLRTKIEK